MNYEAMSNEELFRLLKEKVPELEIDQVNDFNRETVIAYLKISGDGENMMILPISLIGRDS